MNIHRNLIAATALAILGIVVGLGIIVAAISKAYSAFQSRTQLTVLVTADGLRWQDLFTGIDAALMNEKAAGMADAKDLRARLWKDTPEARRETLMPFFWKEIAGKGVVLGNVSKGSSVRVTNAFRLLDFRAPCRNRPTQPIRIRLQRQ